jgi:threonine synthase
VERAITARDATVPNPARGDGRRGEDEEEESVSATIETPAVPVPRTAAASPFGYARCLVCRECRAEQPLGPFYACPECFGPLEVGYDFPSITRADVEAGPANIWRYADLLPVRPDIADIPNTEPGLTRLIRADNLARELGLRRLWVKDDSGNPTHSFKDRVVAVALAAARELGFRVLACPSTGNLANAVASAAARAGIKSVVLIPENLERPKILTTAVYGGALVAVKGNYDDVNRLASEIAGEEDGWAFVNVNVRPYYAEGSKTLAYEVAEQLGWRLPQQIVIPVASGSQLTKVDKGLIELGRLGLVEPTPYRIFGAQAAGCSPVATAYREGHDVVRPVKPDTIAKSLAIGNPADGPYVLDVCRRTGGAVESVTDDEVRDGIQLLARTEGVFAETAGGVTVATLKKLIESGQLDPDAETVVFNTGDGLKTLDAIADRVGPAATIEPTYSAFAATGLTGLAVAGRTATTTGE